MVLWFGRALVAGLLALGCLAVVPSALAADHVVTIEGFAFSPETVTVTVGDTVTWTNGDSTNHTATADGASFDTGTIAGGSSKAATFASAGTFGYHCAIHPAMTGTVVVKAATAPATDTIAATPSRPAPGDAGPGWLATAALGGLLLGAWRGRRRARSLSPGLPRG
jgi:plastocyanin